MREIDWDLEGEELDKAIKKHEAQCREVTLDIAVKRLFISAAALVFAVAALVMSQVRAGMGG